MLVHNLYINEELCHYVGIVHASLVTEPTNSTSHSGAIKTLDTKQKERHMNEELKNLIELYFTNEEFRTGLSDLIWEINESKKNEEHERLLSYEMSQMTFWD